MGQFGTWMRQKAARTGGFSLDKHSCIRYNGRMMYGHTLGVIPMSYKLTVRMDAEQKDQLLAKANESGLTLSEVVRALLEAWLKDEIQVNIQVKQKD